MKSTIVAHVLPHPRECLPHNVRALTSRDVVISHYLEPIHLPRSTDCLHELSNFVKLVHVRAAVFLTLLNMTSSLFLRCDMWTE